MLNLKDLNAPSEIDRSELNEVNGGYYFVVVDDLLLTSRKTAGRNASARHLKSGKGFISPFEAITSAGRISNT